MPNSRCFLIGHRDTSSDILPSLTTEIEHHIREQGITEFVVGQYGGFDRLAAHALYRCKTEYPGLTLTLLCAYHPAERAVILPRGFDGFWYPAGLEQVPRRFAIQRANWLAVEQSEYLIAGCATPAAVPLPWCAMPWDGSARASSPLPCSLCRMEAPALFPVDSGAASALCFPCHSPGSMLQ